MDLSTRGLREGARGQSDSGEGNADYFPSIEAANAIGRDLMQECWGIESGPFLSPNDNVRPPQTVAQIHNFNTSLVGSTKKFATLTVRDPSQPQCMPSSGRGQGAWTNYGNKFALGSDQGVHRGSELFVEKQSFPTSPRRWNPFDDVYPAPHCTGSSESSEVYRGAPRYSEDIVNQPGLEECESDPAADGSLMQQSELVLPLARTPPMADIDQWLYSPNPIPRSVKTEHGAGGHHDFSAWHEQHDINEPEMYMEREPMASEPHAMHVLSPTGIDPHASAGKKGGRVIAKNKACLIAGCTAFPYRQARHLEKDHNYTKADAKTLCSMNKLSRFVENRPRYPSGRLSEGYKLCPRCGITLKRLTNHTCVPTMRKSSSCGEDANVEQGTQECESDPAASMPLVQTMHPPLFCPDDATGQANPRSGLHVLQPMGGRCTDYAIQLQGNQQSKPADTVPSRMGDICEDEYEMDAETLRLYISSSDEGEALDEIDINEPEMYMEKEPMASEPHAMHVLSPAGGIGISTSKVKYKVNEEVEEPDEIGEGGGLGISTSNVKYNVNEEVEAFDEIEEGGGIGISTSKVKYNVDGEVHKLLADLREWGMSCDGGKLEKTTLNTYISGCGQCIEYLGGTILSIRRYRNLGNSGGFIAQMLAKSQKKARSIRIAMFGMQKLLQYLGQMEVNHVFEKPADLARAALFIGNYARSLNKTANIEKQQNKIKSLVVVEDLIPKMANYSSTVHFSDAKSIIAKLNGGKNIQPCDFYHLKAYLITVVFKATGHRTGVVINWLVSEYTAARPMGNNEHQISVKTHKSSQKGPALITVSMELLAELGTYIIERNRRIQDDKFLFPTSTGRRMESGSVVSSVSRALGMHCNVNNIRQSHVTMGVEDNASDIEMKELAKSMGHSSKTQAEYYDVTDQRATAKRAQLDMSARLEKRKVCTVYLIGHDFSFHTLVLHYLMVSRVLC